MKKSWIKRVSCILFTAMITVIGFTACGGNNANTSQNSNQNSSIKTDDSNSSTVQNNTQDTSAEKGSSKGWGNWIVYVPSGLRKDYRP